MKSQKLTKLIQQEVKLDKRQEYQSIMIEKDDYEKPPESQRLGLQFYSPVKTDLIRDSGSKQFLIRKRTGAYESLNVSPVMMALKNTNYSRSIFTTVGNKENKDDIERYKPQFKGRRLFVDQKPQLKPIQRQILKLLKH